MIRTTATAIAMTLITGAVSAATLGAPTFTTEEVTVRFLNNFEGGLPGPLTTVSFNGTIASSVGLPELVGDSISFSETGGLDITDQSLRINGNELVYLLIDEGQALISPPLASDTDNGDGTFTFEFAGDFAGYGPRISDFPDILLGYRLALNGPVPEKMLFLFCDDFTCATTDVNDPVGLGLVDPVLDTGFSYLEGAVQGTVTFFTIDGDPLPPAPVPLPASGLLILAGLGGLAAARRKRAI